MPLTRTDAFVAVAYCAAFSDGSIDAEEDEELAGQLASIHALSTCDEPTLRAAMQKVDAMARQEGDDAVLREAASVLGELSPTAFALGVDLVLADGEIAEEERAFIERLRSALAVEPALAERIVDVVLIRNRA